MHAEFWWENLLEDGHLEDQEGGGRMVLNLLAVSSMFHIVSMFVTVDLQTIFYASFVAIYDFRTKIHMPNSRVY
jgi:hypothetical protein